MRVVSSILKGIGVFLRKGKGVKDRKHDCWVMSCVKVVKIEGVGYWTIQLLSGVKLVSGDHSGYFWSQGEAHRNTYWAEVVVNITRDDKIEGEKGF